MNDEQLAPYLDMTEDELYEALGARLLGSGPGMSPDDRRGAGDFGRRWFRNQYTELQQRICRHQRVQGFLGNSTSDYVLDAGTVYGILLNSSALIGDPVAVAVLTALVMRIGLSAFCANVPPEA